MAKKPAKYEVKCVNNGQAFDFPPWTNKNHKEVLREVAKFQDKLDEKALDEKYRIILVRIALESIDPTITEEKLDELHSDDLLSLFTAAYLSGRKGILSEGFRKAQKKSQKPTK